jgi:drug/metabolite transporter (DMT)-like permease
MTSSDSSSAWLRAMPIVFVLIWSTGFIVARYGMPYAPPMKFLATRYALSLLCFAAWVALARVKLPTSRTQWLHLAAVGVLVHAGYLGGVWSAVKLGMGSGLSSLIVGLQPVLTALWMSYVGGKVTARQWGGLALGFIGLLLVVSTKLGHGEATVVNLSFAAIALLSITIGTLYQKRFVSPCDVRSANAVQLGAALLVTLPLALLEPEAMQWNSQLAWAMAWSVVGLTLGGSSLLYILIQRGAATSVTSLLYLVPPTTAFLAWVLFGEAITATTVLGTALTALGVFLVVRAPAATQALTPPRAET